jgi:hypothetical protein
VARSIFGQIRSGSAGQAKPCRRWSRLVDAFEPANGGRRSAFIDLLQPNTYSDRDWRRSTHWPILITQVAQCVGGPAGIVAIILTFSSAALAGGTPSGRSSEAPFGWTALQIGVNGWLALEPSSNHLKVASTAGARSAANVTADVDGPNRRPRTFRCWAPAPAAGKSRNRAALAGVARLASSR